MVRANREKIAGCEKPNLPIIFSRLSCDISLELMNRAAKFARFSDSPGFKESDKVILRDGLAQTPDKPRKELGDPGRHFVFVRQPPEIEQKESKSRDASSPNSLGIGAPKSSTYPRIGMAEIRFLESVKPPTTHCNEKPMPPTQRYGPEPRMCTNAIRAG